ncbi:MAG: hypothetical protein IPM29_03730 [Planctomycetes bacterium]|nr:hypothetical protein [Planctomycetota bacterium]
MRYLPTLVLLLAVQPISVTTTQIVSPHPQFAFQEGDLSTPYLFTRSSRLQQIHEDLNGTPMLISGIAFRRDGILNGDPHPAVAPKTITLSVSMAGAVPCAQATATFASNATSTPTLVFQGTISTPASWQLPAREAPAPFDVRIPLVPWPWTGQGAFLWDADASATSTADRVSVDSAQPSFPLFAWCSYTMRGFGCTTPNGEFSLRGSGQTLGAPIQQLTVRASARGGPASAPAAWVIGFVAPGGSLPGLCAPVWPVPAVSAGGTTDAAGSWDPLFQVPYNPAWLALPLEMQAAAADASQPGLPVALTNGLTYAAQPLGPAFSVCTVQSSTSGSPTGTLLQRAAVVRFD